MSFVVLAIVLVVYLAPSLIAVHRKHRSKLAIIFVNILLGGTGVGWIWALIWSLSDTHNHAFVINVNNGVRG